ncbi:Uncharacterised protein [Shigella sonnei]|nr:Uncharacterised protein [Shigella sonnei]CSS59735.1 Uncharacterised protein [Shigella sonnei]SRN44378.1 Uncharacterised protein [Shigella flexneri]
MQIKTRAKVKLSNKGQKLIRGHNAAVIFQSREDLIITFTLFVANWLGVEQQITLI